MASLFPYTVIICQWALQTRRESQPKGAQDIISLSLLFDVRFLWQQKTTNNPTAAVVTDGYPFHALFHSSFGGKLDETPQMLAPAAHSWHSTEWFQAVLQVFGARTSESKGDRARQEWLRSPLYVYQWRIKASEHIQTKLEGSRNAGLAIITTLKALPNAWV